MKRRAIVGLASIALLGGCGDRASLDQVAEAQITETTVAAVTAPEVTTEVTLGPDIEAMIVDRLWAQMGGELCDSLNEVIDLDVLTRDEVVDYLIDQVDTSDVSAAQLARMRELIDRDC